MLKIKEKQKIGIYATFYNGPLGKFYKIIPHWDHDDDRHTLDGQLNFAKLEKFKQQHGIGVSIHYNSHLALLKLARNGRQYMRRATLYKDFINKGTLALNKKERDRIVDQFKNIYESQGYQSLTKKQVRLSLGLVA